MVENIHRAGMREAEIVAGVEQLALLGVSAAQIAKRTSIDRPTVNAALAVTKADQSRNRLDSGDLTLEEAAIFAEFEHDPEAVERLENAKRWRRSLAHEAQRLRDEAAEREADAAEVERLRAEGLPVLSAEEVAEAYEVLRIERAADVLLLLRFSTEGEKHVVAGKLYEYVGARRPILCHGQQEGEAADIIRRSGLGLVSNDPAAIADWLSEKLAEKLAERVNGRLPDLPVGAADGLTRAAQFEKVEALLDRSLSNAKKV